MLILYSSVFGQNKRPKSWKCFVTSEYTDSEGITHVDSIFEPTPESDTLLMYIRLTITILPSGEVTDVKILDSMVDFMEGNKLNKERVKFYEDEALVQWKKVYSKESNWYDERKEKITTVLNTNRYVSRKEIFIE
jgi:hypothetical protein